MRPTDLARLLPVSECRSRPSDSDAHEGELVPHIFHRPYIQHTPFKSRVVPSRASASSWRDRPPWFPSTSPWCSSRVYRGVRWVFNISDPAPFICSLPSVMQGCSSGCAESISYPGYPSPRRPHCTPPSPSAISLVPSEPIRCCASWKVWRLPPSTCKPPDPGIV